MNQEIRNYDVILLITDKNIPVLRKSISYIVDNLGADKIYGIASLKNKKDIISLGIEFLNEDEILNGLTLSTIREIIKAKGLNEKRTGWYFQQFIKYAYAYRSNHDYYLTWDADTIPLKQINYFRNLKPTFVEKKEFHMAYFTTISRLFDGKVYRVNDNISYIAENMMFNKKVVREIIEDIEKNDKITGVKFYEKIIESVEMTDFESGFSEFETYGNYVRIFYPEMYDSIKLRTLRNASFFIGVTPEKEQLEWAEKDYDIVSIEGRQYFISDLSKNNLFRSFFRLRNIAKVVLGIRSIRRMVLGKEQLDYD